MAESTKNNSTKQANNNTASIGKELSETSKKANQPQQSRREGDKTTTQYEEMGEIADPIEFWNQWKLRKHECMNMKDGKGQVCNCFEGMGSVM